MTHLAYLGALLVPLACMATVDRRWRLVLWSDWRRSVTVLVVGVVGFLGWDLLAIDQDFYRRGGTSLMTGVEIAPHLPLEEVFFVLFLCYFTLVMHQAVQRLLEHRHATSAEATAEAAGRGAGRGTGR
jgi:lycopene cyclase domain-containing protein